MCSLFLVAIFSLVSATFLLAEADTISCACSTKQCRVEGTKTCNTTTFCFSQFLDRKDGSDPLIRGCVVGNTPLLCENKRPAIGRHREWPVLICCDKNMCNAKSHPTVPTTSTPFFLPTTTMKPVFIEPPTATDTLDRNSWLVVMLVVAIVLVSGVLVTGFFFCTRQTAFCDPEFGVVGSNGYVKGCTGQRQAPSRGLENKLVSDT